MSSTLIEVSEEAGVRYLHFSADWVQGAMRIQRPNSLELAYTREMMAGLLLREPPWPKNALLIGLGAGSLVKYIYHKLPATRMVKSAAKARPVLPANAVARAMEARMRFSRGCLIVMGGPKGGGEGERV